ncbi:MAG: MerR family transcriptional regulator [Phascolarctobacterium sp.]|jgi:transcriptional regulator, MerR family
MVQKLFKSGAFAKLCNTTKDTLFHYDDIGILKPAQVSSNGYRYYSLNQMYMFDLIATLKEVGLSLDEIGEYIKHRDTENFVAMLKEKDKKLNHEIKLLTRRRRLLQNTLKLAEASLEIEEDTIKIEYCDEMYFILSDKVTSTDDKTAFETLSKHFEYVYEHNYYDDFTTGEIVSTDSVEKETFKTTYLSSRIRRAVRSKYLHIRPSGRYAKKYVRSSYANLRQEYKKFYEELKDIAPTTGPIYQNDMTSYLSEQNRQDYLMTLERRIIE